MQNRSLTCSYAFPAVQKLRLEILICLGRNKCKMSPVLCSRKSARCEPALGTVKSISCMEHLIRKCTCPALGLKLTHRSHHITALQLAFSLEYARVQLACTVTQPTTVPESHSAMEILLDFHSVTHYSLSTYSAPGTVVDPGAQS